MTDGPPLVYVQLGAPLPEYAVTTLRVAVERGDGPVVLATDAAVPPTVDHRVTVLPTARWYDPAAFAAFRRRSTLDPAFRGGFWLHAAERFFVLAAAARHLGLDRLLHAELDVLLMPLGGLGARLDRAGRGVFVPRDHPGRAIASLIYVNDTGALDLLNRTLTEEAASGNEMRLLARFLDRHPERGFGLPTDDALRRTWGPRRPRTVGPGTVGGIVDAAALGQWLLGVDPRNTDGPVLNRFRNERMRHDPERLRFTVDRTTGAMTVRRGRSRAVPLLGLHVHSKAMDVAADPGRLADVVARCEAGEATVIVPAGGQPR